MPDLHTDQKIERVRFLSVFEEDKSETLTLKIDLKIKGVDYKSGESFKKNEKIEGIDFHLLRYLDIALGALEDDKYELMGFFAQK